MMNRFFTLLLAVSCLTAVGQHEVDNVCCDPDSYDFDVVDGQTLIQTVLTAGLMTPIAWTITVHNVRMKKRAIT